MQEHFEKVIGRLCTLEGLIERLQTVESIGGFVKIVAVKSAVFTGTQSASVAAQRSLAITNLSISHACQNAANKVLLFGYAGQLANSDGESLVGLAFAHDGTLFPLGTAAGSRTPVGVGGRHIASGSGFSGAGIAYSLHNLYSPGSIGTITYTLHVININSATKTVYVNRNLADSDSELVPRSTSGLLLIEVAS